jgi:spermidine synthase
MELYYLGHYKFVGDLSLQDADVLAKYAEQSKSILEFGSGGSTQIFAQTKPEYMVSIETDEQWVKLTEQKLAMIEEKTDPIFCHFGNWMDYVGNKRFDLIFVDGVDKFRLDFAVQIWNFLNPNGVMIFHDTLRQPDFTNVCNTAIKYFTEVKRIEFNEHASNGVVSNMSVIHKKNKEEYTNWNHTENKPLWTYGAEPMPEGAKLWSQK